MSFIVAQPIPTQPNKFIINKSAITPSKSLNNPLHRPPNKCSINSYPKFKFTLIETHANQKPKYTRKIQNMNNSNFSSSPKINIGRWSKEESKKFIEGWMKFGSNWKNIQIYIATRSCTQVRSHAQKVFAKLGKVTIENTWIDFDSNNLKNLNSVINRWTPEQMESTIKMINDWANKTRKIKGWEFIRNKSAFTEMNDNTDRWKYNRKASNISLNGEEFINRKRRRSSLYYEMFKTSIDFTNGFDGLYYNQINSKLSDDEKFDSYLKKCFNKGEEKEGHSRITSRKNSEFPQIVNQEQLYKNTY